MKHSYTCSILVLLLILTAVAVPARAQTDYGNRQATTSLTAGIEFDGGASMITDPPDNLKVKPIFAWRLVGEGTYPLTPTIGANLQFGIDSRGTRLHAENNADSWQDTHLTYFCLTPAFRFSAFYVGFNFGFPMSVSTAYPNGTSTEGKTTDLNTLMEVRAGAVITLVDEKIGWLGLTIVGGYSLNEFKDTPDSHTDFTLVALHGGLTWQFAIPGTSRQ